MLDASALEKLMIAEMKTAGFDTKSEHAKIQLLAKAMAIAIVTHITADAEVAIEGGSSSGTYKVK